MTLDQKKELRRLRGLGYTQKETAFLLGVAERTVRREERKSEVDEEEISEEEIFEDPEEGWHAHYTKELGLTTPDASSWTFLVYQESAPEGWEEALIQTGCPLVIGPWHDSDQWTHDDPKGTYKAGDLKKVHLHGTLKTPQKISLKKAAMLIQRITHGPVPQVVHDEAGLLAYISHHDKNGNPLPGKHEYNSNEVRLYNGWRPEPTEQDKAVMRLQLERYLTVEGIDNYTIAVNRVRTELGTDFSKLMRQDAHHFRGMIDANRYDVGRNRERLLELIEREMAEETEAERFWEENQKNQQQEDKKYDESFNKGTN